MLQSQAHTGTNLAVCIPSCSPSTHLGELTGTPPPEVPRDAAVWQSALVTGLGRIISARHFLESLVFLLPSPYEKKNRTKSPGILQRGDTVRVYVEYESRDVLGHGVPDRRDSCSDLCINIHCVFHWWRISLASQLAICCPKVTRRSSSFAYKSGPMIWFCVTYQELGRRPKAWSLRWKPLKMLSKWQTWGMAVWPSESELNCLLR